MSRLAPETKAPDAASPRRLGAPTAISADLLAPASRAAAALSFSLVALLAGFVAWASLAEVEESSTGRGRVIPASKLQIVQNLEGGIVRELLVREGQTVREGDVLLRIDPTHFGSNVGEAREKILGLAALMARLEAEAGDGDLAFPDEVSQAPASLVQQQRDLFQSRKRELASALAVLDQQARQRGQEILETDSKVATLGRSLALAEQELAIMRPLERSRAIGHSELLQTEVKVNDIKGGLEAAQLALPRLAAARQEALDKRSEKLNAFHSDALQRLSQARVELGALRESSRSSLDKVERTIVKAPVSGLVKTVTVTTPGQVVQPGSSLIEIVPLNDTLLVEAQVRPQDIAFLRPGQKAMVKLTAYDFSIYGGLTAHVEQIGVDSIMPEKGEPYYPVRVRTEKSHLSYHGEMLPIIPGMVTEVGILTGRKTVMQYLTKPLTRMRAQALHER